ncbi:MAG TPA: heavy-metal-associated domain-containing protein [Gemmatimonadales bacterium]|nr:heavy-metal-associated domain-containing protein [Gemmatimonadales bacterium]
MTPLTLHIEGMSCGHCLNAVNRALSALPGISDLQVKMGRAELNFDANQTTPTAIADAVKAAGYRATPASAA